MSASEITLNNHNLMFSIFTDLDARDLMRCARVCKRWKEIIDARSDSLFKPLCNRIGLQPQNLTSTWKEVFARFFTVFKGEVVTTHQRLDGYNSSSTVVCRPASLGNLVAYYNGNESCIQVDDLSNEHNKECYPFEPSAQDLHMIEIDDTKLIVLESNPFFMKVAQTWTRHAPQSEHSNEFSWWTFLSNRHLICPYYRPPSISNDHNIWDLSQKPMQVQYPGVSHIPDSDSIYKMFFYQTSGRDCLIYVDAFHFFQIVDLKNNSLYHSEPITLHGKWVESILQDSYLTSLYECSDKNAGEVRCWNVKAEAQPYASFSVPTTKKGGALFAAASISHSPECGLFFYHISSQLFVFSMRTGETIHEIASSMNNPRNTSISFFNHSVVLQDSDLTREIHQFILREEGTQATSTDEMDVVSTETSDRSLCSIQ